VLYRPNEPAALARALEQLTDPRRRGALGAAARRRAEREFSWSIHCERLEAAIERSRGARLD
jgi:glycosyltransferase involved in cell wall biosynthesis